MNVGGRFEVRVVRRGRAVAGRRARNAITDVGLHSFVWWLVDDGSDEPAGLPATSGPTGVVSLIDAAGFTGVATSDTMASHPGWELLPAGRVTEEILGDGNYLAFALDEDEGTVGPTFGFTVIADCTVRGVILTDHQPGDVLDADNVLWSVASFDELALEEGDLVTGRYVLGGVYA